MGQQTYDVLIIGGGIAGMQAALDLAETGYRVAVAEQQSSIGGTMAQLDKTFPTNDCAICIAAPRMVDIARHPNITLLPAARLEEVSGVMGNFRVTLWQRSGFVDPTRCTGCGDCARVCPVQVPDPFNAYLSTRAAIALPFPQAVPAVASLDLDYCVGCGACVRACPPDAISFLQAGRPLHLDVASIIVATGFDLLDPSGIRPEYGYGRFPNVLTARQYERMLSASGPTGGHIRRPDNGQEPRRIAWVQCVGSRSAQHGVPYCSKICCMYATKQAVVTQEHLPGSEASIYYLDLRATGKEFQRYYERAQQQGVRYVRGRPAQITSTPEQTLRMHVTDTQRGTMLEEDFDMVVLATAAIPQPDTPRLAQVLGIALDEGGFFAARDLLRHPGQSTREGIFLAGGAAGPLDIPDAVAQASAAAARALGPLRERPRTLRPAPPPERPDADGTPRVGVMVCRCGTNIAGVVDVPTVAQQAADLPGVAWTEDSLFACAEDAQRTLAAAIDQHNLNRVVIAACSPITHAPVFQQTCQGVGLNPHLVEMANIRNQCSWVHGDRPDEATHKAQDLVRMAVGKAHHLTPLPHQEVSVLPRCLIIGGGIAGMTAALRLAALGIDTVLVERGSRLGGTLTRLNRLAPGDVSAETVLQPLRDAITQHPRIRVLTDTTVGTIDGSVGQFQAELVPRHHRNSAGEMVEVGTIILATGMQEASLDGRYGKGRHPEIITQLELEQRLRTGKLGRPRLVAMLNCAGSLEPDNPTCCRIGCGIAVKNARLLHEALPNTRLVMLTQDLRLSGPGEDEAFAALQAQAAPLLLRYPAGHPPDVRVQDGQIVVTVADTLLGEDVAITPDLLVLTAALRGDEQTAHLQQQLTVSTTADGFYREAHAKIRPLESATAGIYLCGGAHGPRTISDTIAQAEGAAARAAIPLLRGTVPVEPEIAEIDPARCTGCGQCVPLCPYGALALDEVQSIATINEARCAGCGTCVAACPGGAAQQRGFNDPQLLAMIEAAWA